MGIVLDYWELSEKERSTLTQEQVDRFADYELMQKGVLRASTLELEPVPEMPAPSTQVFRIGATNRYSRTDVAFASVADAEAFLRLKPLLVETSYVSGDNVSYASPLTGGEISATLMLTAEEFACAKSAISRAHEIKSANEKRQQEHERALKAQESALVDMWSDWRKCRELAASHARVIKTFDEYRVTAGDNDVAAKFLLKAFTRQAITEAAEWHDLTIELPAEFTGETLPKASSELTGDGVPF